MNNATMASKVAASAIAVALSGDGYSGDGFSFNAFCDTPKSGYMVALQGHEQIVTPYHNLVKSIADYVDAHFDMLVDNPSLYFGGWFNDGKLYLDISESFQDVRKAKIAGAKRHQIAIWDVVHSREIVL